MQDGDECRAGVAPDAGKPDANAENVWRPSHCSCRRMKRPMPARVEASAVCGVQARSARKRRATPLGGIRGRQSGREVDICIRNRQIAGRIHDPVTARDDTTCTGQAEGRTRSGSGRGWPAGGDEVVPRRGCPGPPEDPERAWQSNAGGLPQPPRSRHASEDRVRLGSVRRWPRRHARRPNSDRQPQAREARPPVRVDRAMHPVAVGKLRGRAVRAPEGQDICLLARPNAWSGLPEAVKRGTIGSGAATRISLGRTVAPDGRPGRLAARARPTA